MYDFHPSFTAYLHTIPCAIFFFLSFFILVRTTCFRIIPHAQKKRSVQCFVFCTDSIVVVKSSLSSSSLLSSLSSLIIIMMMMISKEIQTPRRNQCIGRRQIDCIGRHRIKCRCFFRSRFPFPSSFSSSSALPLLIQFKASQLNAVLLPLLP